MKNIRFLSLPAPLAAFVVAVMHCIGIAPAQAQSAAPSFGSIIDSVRVAARAQGVTEPTLSRALDGLQPVDGLQRLENFQPETVKSFAQYYKDTVTPARIEKGREMKALHAHELRAIEDRYGVPAQYLLAIWAMETNYGANMGKHSAIPALVTLVRDGRNEKRRDYFKAEAVAALKILDQGYDQILNRPASWAGAFGHTQFMPTSFLRLAVDGDGDGRKDIWNNLSDVFASTGAYLAHHNWKKGDRWGREVKLPAGFNAGLLTDTLRAQTIKTPAEWRALGVTLPSGASLPGDDSMNARVIAPDGMGGPAYVVYDNFISIMRYNSSYKYALSVAGLADGIAGGRVVLTAPSGATLNQ